MAAISNRERLLKDKVIDKCWAYLNANFDNFSDNNKLKILIALCTKSIPQEVTGEVNHTVEMPVIKLGSRPLEFHIGSNWTAGNAQYPAQAIADHWEV